MRDQDKIIVQVDADIEALIPIYLQNKKKDEASILEALGKGDYETIRLVGHSMKGSGGGYGFQKITDIGAMIEQAAKNKHDEQIRQAIDELSSYLDRLEVVYI